MHIRHSAIKLLAKNLALITTILLATAAALRAQTTTSMLLTGVGDGNTFGDVYVDPYTATVGGTANIAVICDDWSDDSNLGDSWTATVINAATVSNSADGTPLFGNNQGLYNGVAWLSAQLLNPATLAPGLGDLVKIMVERYKAKSNAVDVPPHCSMGFNQTWVLLNNVLPVAKEKYGSFDAEAVRQAALDVDIPPGGTIQGYGVKFYRPGTEMSGQNERSTPVVMQFSGEHIAVVWPTNIKTQDPILPLPASSTYAMR